MSTQSANGVDEAFVELICADEQLLRAEFDAIVAGQWPGRPAVPPRRWWSAGRRPGRSGAAAAGAHPGRPPRPVRASGGRRRQRSPPGPRAAGTT